MNEHQLLITAMGKERKHLLRDLTKICLNCGLSIAESRITLLGDTVAMIIELCGGWNAVAKLEAQLSVIKDTLGLDTIATRLTSGLPEKHIPYSVELTAIDRPGILYEVLHFFSANSIQVVDCKSDVYHPPKGQTPLFCMQLIARVGPKVNISTLRDEFFTYCDERNLDATIEPHRS